MKILDFMFYTDFKGINLQINRILGYEATSILRQFQKLYKLLKFLALPSSIIEHLIGILIKHFRKFLKLKKNNNKLMKNTSN